MSEKTLSIYVRTLVALAAGSAALGFFALASGAVACSNSGNQLGQPDGGVDATTTGATGAIELTSLRVSLSPGTASALVPPFSRDLHDYYVLCAAGTNTLTVSMTAAPGAKSVLLQPTESAPAPMQVVTLSVQENQAIVAAATDGTASNEYWVRCLPTDFPMMQVDLYPEAGAPEPGYYLVGNQSPSATGGSYAMVLNVDGVPVWYHREATQVWDVDYLVGGAITFRPLPSSYMGFEARQLSPVDTAYIQAQGTPIDVHELRVLPNGDVLVLSDQDQTGVDLTGFTYVLPDGGTATFGKNETIHPCIIMELDSKGDIVWSWDATQHFDVAQDTTFKGLWNLSGGPNGAPVVDPFHCNSIDIDPANGNLLVSSRNMDSVFYVERPSGTVLWKMGGTTYSKDGAVYVPVTNPVTDAFHRQHDARLQPGWSTDCSGRGQISVFDDATSTASPARAALYEVTVGAANGAGQNCASPGATLTWQYPAMYSSVYMGSFRIQEDGTRVIGWGANGDPSLVLSEINPTGNDVLDFRFTDNNQSYRIVKLPLTALDLGLLRETAGL